MQYTIISYFHDIFFLPILNLIYTLVRILPLEKIASPKAFHYVAAADVIFVTEKNLTLCDNGI